MPDLDLASRALPAVEKLEAATDDKLFLALGARLTINKSDPIGVANFDVDEPEYETLGMLNDLTVFGRRYFERVNEQCYDLVCGIATEASTERATLLKAFSLGKSEVAAAMAALLVSQLAIAPAIATVVAVIAIKLFFAPAHEAMCEVWKGKLPSKTD